MNYSTAVFLINPNVRAIYATYEVGGGRILFKTLNQNIKVDDLVVVPTNTRHNYTVVKVVEVDVDFDVDTATKVEWVVDIIDNVSYHELLAQEQNAITQIRSAEMRQKRENLKNALFANSLDTIKALPIASSTGETKVDASAS